MLLTPYFEQAEQLSAGTSPRRAYTIPYASLEEAQTARSRQASTYFTDLNGEWAFKFFPNVRTIDIPYWEQPQVLDWESITVPSCWQLAGYDQIQYTNTEFPIPFDPPYVPYENPAGLYQRYFHFQADADKSCHELVFEGVDSAFYVWLNGQFVGYSQISHATSIFDIHPWLIEGENRLTVLVLKWSDGTYLEDQDKFRFSGIFRDVYLLARSAVRMGDFTIETGVEEDGKGASLCLGLNVIGQESIGVDYLLCDPQGLEVAKGRFPAGLTGQLRLQLQNPQLWSAETPNLYQLYWTLGNETYHHPLGLRTIEIKDQQFFLNHRAIKLKGVNHHDSWPDTGASVSLERQRQDLLLMKDYNFNAIRTAHYPKAPEFYALCDELGFYVISETDLECHGVVDLYGRGGNANYNQLAEDPRFEAAFVERIEANICLLRNFSSIVMWSAGNESGYGSNLEAMLARARQLDPHRPLHYEGYWYHDRQKHYDTPYLDVWSRMYPSVAEIEATYFEPGGAYAPLDRPFILCEYAHAMGNGPGDLLDYYDCMMRHPAFIGAFVWEWADHAIEQQGEGDPDGLPIYRYGGDHGEYPHAGNFCMDGLMYPDRQPHSGVLEYRQIHRPVRLVAFDQIRMKASFRNDYDFLDVEDHLSLEVIAYDKTGQVCETQVLTAWQVAPHQTSDFELSLTHDLSQLSSLRFVYHRRVDDQIVGEDQVLLQAVTWHPLGGSPQASQAPWLREEAETYLLGWGDQCYRISKGQAMLTSLCSGDIEYLQAPGSWTIWRAPTDNDRIIVASWRQANYHRTQVRVHQWSSQITAEGVQVCFEGVIAGVARQAAVSFQGVWTLNQEGQLQLSVQGQRASEMPVLPRFGCVLPLKSVSQASYLGYGPYENYRDKHHSSYWGRFTQPLMDFYEPYVTPQENGSRQALRAFFAFDRSERGLALESETNFSFNLSPYSARQLSEVGHRDKLRLEEAIYLHLDYKQAGIGSQSCGPELAEAYQFNEENFAFEWTLCLI